MSPAASSQHPPLGPLARANLALLAMLAGAFSVLLWPQWRHNPELSHGLFMPLIFVLLLRESRSSDSLRYWPASSGSIAAVVVLLAAGLLSLAAAGLLSAAVGWSHALVLFALAGALVLLLLAGLLAFSESSMRLVPINWTSLMAVFLWLFCAPIPPGTYARLTLTLQLWVTCAVLGALHLVGIAAVRDGNLIELGHATVGVEEACSGVRSLISCVFAGFFFSAALVRRPSARAWLIAAATPLALVMNFFRSLALTLLADRGVDISRTWHDATGYAVLGVTALLLGGLAMALSRRAAAAPASAPEIPIPASAIRPRLQQWLAGGLVLAIAFVMLFAANTHHAPAASSAPDLAAVVPENAEGWAVQTSGDLYQFTGVLQTDRLVQRTYLKHKPGGNVVQVTIYVAYWAPGQAPVSLVASHTPDACWPGAGWSSRPTPNSRVGLTVAGRQLPPAESRVFQNAPYLQNVWFWHLYDGRPLLSQDPRSVGELLRLGWKYGFGREGAQFFVRISSNCPWSDFADEPLMRQIFSRLQPYGL